MKEVALSLPLFGFVVATRAALGVGIGLLISEKLSPSRRRAVGSALVAVGAATTVPAALSVIRRIGRSDRGDAASINVDRRLAGATRFARKGDDLY
jgi:hypothetical protein